MLCYKDMTFCKEYFKCADGAKCDRALTPEVQAEADEWWGKGKNKAPICHWVDEPYCFKPLYITLLQTGG